MAFYTFRYIRAGEKRDKQTAGTKAVWLSCGAVVWYLLLLPEEERHTMCRASLSKFYHTEPGKEEEVSNIREFRLKPTNLKIKIDMRKLNRLFPAGSFRRVLLRGFFLK